MKITLDIPDDTICGIFNFIYGNWGGLTMEGHSIPTEKMKDGAVIKIKPPKEGEQK